MNLVCFWDDELKLVVKNEFNAAHYIRVVAWTCVSLESVETVEYIHSRTALLAEWHVKTSDLNMT